MDIASVLQTLPGLMTIVNVVILLSAIFFFTSTLASHLLEAFVGLINSRGKQLRERLELALGKDVAEAIYNDPLIKSLTSGSDPANPAKLNPPSYIEPEFFARVVAKLAEVDGAVSKSEVIKEIKAVAAAPAQLEAKLVEWFKAINDRQSGVYTRWSFFRLMVIGFLFAAAMDIDTVHIAGTIWNKPELAEKVAKELEQAAQISNSGELTPEQRKKLQDAVASAWAQVRSIEPPMYAWQRTNLKTKEWPPKLLGWLLTALATSLGAQFWFNILSEGLKLRASGRKPKDDPKPQDDPKKKKDGAGQGGQG